MTFDGKEIYSNGKWTMICKIFISIQSFFKEKPKNIDKARFVVIVPSKIDSDTSDRA